MTHPKKPKHHKRKEHHMALSVSNTRKAVVIDYSEDQDQVTGDSVTGSATNASGDVGSRHEQNNDGEFVFFFPKAFTTDEEEVTLTGSDGGSITGTISID